MFLQALNLVLAHEGYYANVTGDTGGETYRGISRRYHPSWNGWQIVDQEKNAKGGKLPHNHRIINSFLDQLIQDFYRQNFWDKIFLDAVKDSSLQIIIFDGYVNMGGNAVKLLQEALNQFGHQLKVDGAIGAKTIAAINTTNAQQLFNAYKTLRESYYHRIAKNGDNSKFLKGWLKRIQSFNYTTISLSLMLVTAVGLFFLIRYLNKGDGKNS